MFIVFDIETTGLPPYNPKGKGFLCPLQHIEEWKNCRIVELAWYVCEENGTIVKKKVCLIKPKYFTIPEESTNIHGISHKKAKLKGLPLEEVLNEFMTDVTASSLLVSHNIMFDYHVLLSEYVRLYEHSQLKPYMSIEKYCTMLRGSNPNEKWCKLNELYEKCFQKKPELELHRALNDVQLCYEIYMYQTGKN